jgi:LysM repeat protein
MAMYRRTPLRFLAPVVLIGFGVALLLVVKSYTREDTAAAPSATEQAKERDLGTTKKTKKSKTKSGDKLPKNVYTVKLGDTLGSISEKTGIPIATLQELNPKLDPQTLRSGQKVKLRE